MRRSSSLQRSIAFTAADHLAAFGWRPKLRSEQHKIIGGPRSQLMVRADIADNAVVATDLRAASLWDVRAQQFYGSGNTPVRAFLHLEGLRLYVYDADLQAETPAIHEAIDDRAYVTVSAGGVTQKIPLRGHIRGAFGFVDFKQASAAAEVRVLFPADAAPYWLERPFGVDLEADTFSFNIDSAINYGATDLKAFVEVYGSLIPKGTVGGEITNVNAAGVDTDDIDDGGAYSAVSGLQLGGIAANFWQRISKW